MESIKTKILLGLVTKGMTWLGRKFVEKVRGDEPTTQEVEAFFRSGLDESKAHDLLQGFVNDLVKSVESRFKESELTDSELKPVASYLEILLERLDITPKLLAEYDYDPAALSRHAESLGTPGEMASLSEPQRLLIREVLRNLGAPLLRLGFDVPASVAQLHRRNGELQQTVNEIRADILRTREISETNNPDRHLQEFEEVYQTRLVESLNVMELLGLDDVRRNLRRYPLEAAFVHLRLDASKRAVKFQDALEQHSKLFLKGIAGSGKTTLMRWLAIMAARGKLDGYPHLKGKLPVLVTLRDYNDSELPDDLRGLLKKSRFMPPVSPERLEEVLHERRHRWPYKIWVRPTGRATTSHILAVQDSRNGTATRPMAGYPGSSTAERHRPGRDSDHRRPRSSLRRRPCNRACSSSESTEKRSATKSSWAGTTSSKSSRPSGVR